MSEFIARRKEGFGFGLSGEARRQQARSRAIEEFTSQFPRGSLPSGSKLVQSLRALRYESIVGAPHSGSAERIGVPEAVVKEVIARSHDAIEKYLQSGQGVGDSNELHRGLDEALRLATTEAGIKAFASKALGARVKVPSPADDRQALDDLYRDALFDTKAHGGKKLAVGDGYTAEAASEAFARATTAIRDYQRSDKKTGENNSLWSATSDAARFLDVDAGINQFEAAFPRDGAAPPSENVLAAVQNLHHSLHGSGATQPNTYQVPLRAEVAQEVVGLVRAAIDRYNGTGRTIGDRNNLWSDLSHPERLLGIEVKRAVAQTVTESRVGEPVEVRGSIHVSRTRVTHGGFIMFEPDFSWDLAPKKQSRLIAVHSEPGVRRAEYMGQMITLEPKPPPSSGGDRLEWTGSARLPSGEHAYLRLQLNDAGTGVEKADIVHSRYQGETTRTETFSGQTIAAS